MSLHELLEQGPSVYVPVILISLLITLLAYGAFPMIYSRARSQAISSKKFTLHCYGFNFLVLAIFICINGASSGGPYVLWTGVFSGTSGDTELFEKPSNINGFRASEQKNILYIPPH